MAAMAYFPVSVKESNGRNNYMINVGTTWDVAQVKREIASQSGMSMDAFKIVFAGMELKDQMTLQDIGVQSTSTLHCVRGNFPAVQVAPAAPAKSLNKLNLGGIESTDDAGANPPDVPTRFYVYCKKPCGALAPGKLRVRCSTCKDTSFVLTTGPSGWEDVLEAGKMHGRCSNTGCNGSVAEFYFKCANHRTDDNDLSVPLHMIRVNTVGVECITCATERKMVVVFGCDVGHSMCIGCFVEYCEDALNNRRYKENRILGYTIQCPAGCDGSEVKEIHHFRVLGEKNYERYQRFGAEECLREMGGVFCPAANCGMGLLPDPGQRRIQCTECNFVFCGQCRNHFHPGSCDAVPAQGEPEQGGDESHRFTPNPHNVERARWAAANDRYVRDNSKPCPHCRAPIEKNGGCNHMTCVMCSFEFCWICLINWNGNCQSAHWFQ